MPNSEIKAWLVDLDGTLYANRPVRLAMACELVFFGFPAIRVIRSFRGEHEAMRQEESSQRSPNSLPAAPYDLQLDRTASRLAMPRERVSKLIETWMHRRPGKWLWLFRQRKLLQEIAHFHEMGGKTAIVSDYPASAKLAALRAADLFDVVVANGESGGPTRLKPSPEGYLLAAQRLGVLPENCLVIGDRDDADGLAAKSAQMAFRKV
jgi:HAD superfamily hydrolase (TIGR01549 family)